MNRNHEKYRKLLEIARRVRPDSKILKMNRSVDEYLKGQLRHSGAYHSASWLYFGIEEAEECQKTIKPNVWVALQEDGSVAIGLAFNANPSVTWAANILKGYSADVKERLFAHLESGGLDWKAVVQRRTKFHPSGRPIYTEEYSVLISELGGKIEEIITQSIRVRDEYRAQASLLKDDPRRCDKTTGKIIDPSGGVSFNLIEKRLPDDAEEFAKAFAFAHDALEICLKIKTPAQHKREMNKKYNAWQCRSGNCKKLHDPVKTRVQVCEKCGTNTKPVGITKEKWMETFGYAPDEIEVKE